MPSIENSLKYEAEFSPDVLGFQLKMNGGT